MYQGEKKNVGNWPILAGACWMQVGSCCHNWLCWPHGACPHYLTGTFALSAAKNGIKNEGCKLSLVIVVVKRDC